MMHYVALDNKSYDGLNPMLYGYHDCKPGQFFGPAIRTYWIIHYVVSGFGIFRTCGREYRVGPGEMFVIRPFAESYYEADKENPWTYTWIAFSTEMEELPSQLDDIVRCPDALTVFADMKKCEKMENGRSAYLSAKTWELFSIILESREKTVDYVQKALSIIHSAYMTDLSVETLAREVNLERTYFSTLFKNKVGVSPGKYILSYRMSLAASLIADKGMSVSVAGASVGYSDIFNFSKMFKKHYGVSPKEYVKNNSENKPITYKGKSNE